MWEPVRDKDSRVNTEQEGGACTSLVNRGADSGQIWVEPYEARRGWIRVTSTKEVATLAGGCFWCLEAVYEQVTGVEKVVSGYAGGHVTDPTYEDVCAGTTGHAEVVQVTFDPATVSYREVLEIFFSIHDPTTLNRQGGDVGTQYRSAVFTHSPAQKKTAEETVRDLSRRGLWRDPVVTRIEPLAEFYPAESYHQHYFARNPQNPYCRTVVNPKVAKFRKQWASKLRAVTS